MRGDNKAVLMRAIEDYLVGVDDSHFQDIYATGCMVGGPDFGASRYGLARTLDPASIRDHRLIFKSVFPDMEFRVDEVIEDGDRVAARWTVCGQHCGNAEARAIRKVLDLPDEAFSVSGVAFCRLRSGKIVEMWQLSDMITLAKCLRFNALNSAGIPIQQRACTMESV